MKKGKKLIIGAGSFILIVILIFVSYISFAPTTSYYEQNKKYWQSFGIFAYETLRYESTPEEETEAQPILNKVEEAFSYMGREEDCPIEEPYRKLCRFTDSYHHKFSDYNIKFVAFKKFLNYGYVWFEYTQVGYDENENMTNGSRDIPTMIKVERKDGEWVAVSLKEVA